MSDRLTELPQPRDGLDFDDDLDLDVAPAPPASSSVLDALKAARAEVAAAKTYELEVPGWRGLLALRLGPITSQQQQRIIARQQKVNVTSSPDVDVLVAATRCVLGRARPTDPFSVLVDDDGEAVGLDERLAAMLDLGPVRRASEVLTGLFAGANAPVYAIGAAMAEWHEWARDANEEVDDEFLGK